MLKLLLVVALLACAGCDTRPYRYEVVFEDGARDTVKAGLYEGTLPGTVCFTEGAPSYSPICTYPEVWSVRRLDTKQ